jgi:hypothetical protein
VIVGGIPGDPITTTGPEVVGLVGELLIGDCFGRSGSTANFAPVNCGVSLGVDMYVYRAEQIASVRSYLTQPNRLLSKRYSPSFCSRANKVLQQMCCLSQVLLFAIDGKRARHRR